MKTPHAALLVLMAVFGLVGCVTPFRAPADVAHVRLEPVDSPVVLVEKIWLERKAGPLVVKGYVLMRLQADDTTQTHLDVTLYDAGGGVLRRTIEHFEPQNIVRRMNRPSHATYRVPLDPLPADTVRVEVRAHEGEHGSSHG